MYMQNIDQICHAICGIICGTIENLSFVTFFYTWEFKVTLKYGTPGQDTSTYEIYIKSVIEILSRNKKKIKFNIIMISLRV